MYRCYTNNFIYLSIYLVPYRIVWYGLMPRTSKCVSTDEALRCIAAEERFARLARDGVEVEAERLVTTHSANRPPCSCDCHAPTQPAHPCPIKPHRDGGASTLGPGGGVDRPLQIVARPPNLAVLLAHRGQLILRNNGRRNARQRARRHGSHSSQCRHLHCCHRLDEFLQPQRHTHTHSRLHSGAVNLTSDSSLLLTCGV